MRQRWWDEAGLIAERRAREKQEKARQLRRAGLQVFTDVTTYRLLQRQRRSLAPTQHAIRTAESSELAEFIQTLASGHILSMAIQRPCATEISHRAEQEQQQRRELERTLRATVSEAAAEFEHCNPRLGVKT